MVLDPSPPPLFLGLLSSVSFDIHIRNIFICMSMKDLYLIIYTYIYIFIHVCTLVTHTYMYTLAACLTQEHVSFRKRVTNYRAPLRKITYTDKASYWCLFYTGLPIGCLICIGHFLQRSPIISGSFAERDVLSMHVIHMFIQGGEDA